MEAGVVRGHLTRGSTIAYLGRFDLPRGNAAAYRALGNAKALKIAGYRVVLISIADADSHGTGDFNGFDYWSVYARSMVKSRWSTREILDVLEGFEELGGVIAYNYPALSLDRLRRFCRKRGVICLGDVTEWYAIREQPIIQALPKWLDTAVRMRFVHKRLDGLIVISKYLQQYYHEQLTTRVPPLTQMQSFSRAVQARDDGERRATRLVYAGFPSRTKEDLLTVMKALEAPELDGLFSFDVVGVTEDQFRRIYRRKGEQLPSNVCFHGRLTHSATLEKIAGADYSVIVRPWNRVTRAGFPTKFVESLACGTPVIISWHPDLIDSVGAGLNGILVSGNIRDALMEARSVGTSMRVDGTTFDYRKYSLQLDDFLRKVKERVDLRAT